MNTRRATPLVWSVSVALSAILMLPAIASAHSADLACLASHAATPLACVTGYGAASCLTNPAAFPFGFTPVHPNEYALGWPTVEFEIVS